MLVEVKQYSDSSFQVIAFWQDELDNVIADHQIILTDAQKIDIDNGIPVWLTKNIIVKKQ